MKKIKEPMNLMITCHHCGLTHEITVDIEDWFDWVTGDTLIQEAFPYLTPGERELIKAHMCADCWEKMFAGMVEEEEVFVSDEDGFITLSELDIDDFIDKFF